MPSAWIQVWTVVRIGVVSTPPQSVTMPRNSPLPTNVILGALRAAGRTPPVWSVKGRRRNVTGPRYNQDSRSLVRTRPPPVRATVSVHRIPKGGTMPELSARHPFDVCPVNVRLVKVPDAAPPYDCQVHGTQCPAPVGQAVAPTTD